MEIERFEVKHYDIEDMSVLISASRSREFGPLITRERGESFPEFTSDFPTRAVLAGGYIDNGLIEDARYVVIQVAPKYLQEDADEDGTPRPRLEISYGTPSIEYDEGWGYLLAVEPVCVNAFTGGHVITWSPYGTGLCCWSIGAMLRYANAAKRHDESASEDERWPAALELTSWADKKEMVDDWTWYPLTCLGAVLYYRDRDSGEWREVG